MSNIVLPNRKESTIVVIGSTLFILLTAIFVGLRPEHIFLTAAFLILFFAGEKSRKLAVGLIPFILFGISYDWMRVYPNYMVNNIDIKNLYELEKSLFGISVDGSTLIPCEYFAIHNNKIIDFLAGIFYFGWVPVPIIFALYLYFTNNRALFLKFSMAFLFVNLLGFSIYYIYPAAPPWYAMEYGFEAVLDTPGNMAGLSRFDDLIGIPLFASIYGRNANVFAAVPSLHSAYLAIVLFYALVKRCSIPVLIIISVFLCGIWFTAVYTAHHYIIDVLLGIVCAVVGVFIFEKVLLKARCFKTFFNNYNEYIS